MTEITRLVEKRKSSVASVLRDDGANFEFVENVA